MKNRIDFFRREQGRTIEELAGLAGISYGQIQKLMSGQRRLYSPDFPKCAKALNKYPSELLPIEWQKPAEIDTKILKTILNMLLRMAEEHGIKLAADDIASVVSLLYKKEITKPSLVNVELESDVNLLLQREIMDKK